MEKKNFLIIASAFLGGTISTFLGGFDKNLIALLVIVTIDFVMGYMVAGIFKNSPKTESGGLSSKVGFKGLVKKIYLILLVAVLVQVDIILGTDGFFRNAGIWGFITNELLSIIENAGLMGIQIPVLTKAIDVLSKKEGE